MLATSWEFKNRAFIFGLLIACSFGLYSLDKQNITAVLANALADRFASNSDLIARLLFGVAALLLSLAAFLRTWASAYLQANIVYAKEIKTAELVADGPYRFVRNPLYFANVLLAIGIGLMMSRIGFTTVILLMIIFCYRLIFREESELQLAQPANYAAFQRAVPRLWPALTTRVNASNQRPNWLAGFKAESWYWCFPLGVAAFAITLDQKYFFITTALGVALLLGMSATLKPNERE